MASKNLIIIAIIAVIVVVALAATALLQPQGPQTAIATGDKATKLAFQNNGTTWLQINAVMENVTLKNGTKQTFYNEIFIKPNDTAAIDLGNLTGYSDERLPAGTTIRILAWHGLFNQVAGGTGDMNLNLQGWSNTARPGPGDAILNVFYSGLPVSQLSAGINETKIVTVTDLGKVDPAVSILDDPSQNILYAEYLLTVDQNGKVTITLLKTPELCILFAGDTI
ncbi:MAG: hypothetical protein PQ975_10060 [Methanobacterium sp.]|jgi:hypothetical protein